MPIIPYRALKASDGRDYGLFDSDRTEEFRGGFMPRDRFSSSTAKQDLYLLDTKDVWVLNTVDLGEFNHSTYVEITPDEAEKWLRSYGYPEAADRHFSRPKGGRPRIGEKLTTRVPARTYNQIAELSEMYAEDMPETVRRLIDEALAHRETIGAPGSPQDRYDI